MSYSSHHGEVTAVKGKDNNTELQEMNHLREPKLPLYTSVGSVITLLHSFICQIRKKPGWMLYSAILSALLLTQLQPKCLQPKRRVAS